jgi:hypothetical protein
MQLQVNDILKNYQDMVAQLAHEVVLLRTENQALKREKFEKRLSESQQTANSPKVTDKKDSE